MEFDLVFSIGDMVSIAFGLVGVIGIIFAYKQIKISQTANSVTAKSTRAQFALHVSQWFFDDPDTMKFFYRLDYDTMKSSFSFDASSFSGSEEEFQLDRLLYKISHVGGLVKRAILQPSDIEGLAAIIRIVCENQEVAAYLKWLQSDGQIPHHADFTDAIDLYCVLFGQNLFNQPHLSTYRQRAKADSC